jgi:hypothetical protein
MSKDWKRPPLYSVYVTATPIKKNGRREAYEAYTTRLGGTDNETEIKRIIADNEKAMGNSFGGLIDTTPTHRRTYRAFRAEWTEVQG